MTIMWQTNESCDSTISYSEDLSFSQSATGIESKPSWASGYIHRTTVTGLTPGTVYNYFVGDSLTGNPPLRTFKTAPSGSTSFSFIEAGDTRNSAPTTYDFQNWQATVDAISGTDTDLVMFVGDNVYDSSVQPAWDAWLQIAERCSSTRPFMEATGNHEYYAGTLSPNYIGQFAFPGSWSFYSFNYSSIHFVVLDNGNSATMPISPGSPQYDWLAQDLEAADSDPLHPWKIVQFHKPPFNSRASDLETRTVWSPLFEQYHVDLVYSGHQHVYERTYPIDSNGNVMDSNTSSYTWTVPKGTIYVTDGTAGAPLYSLGTPQSWSIMQDSNYGFSKLSLHTENNSLEVIHYSSSMSVIDAFWIEKPGSIPIPAPPVVVLAIIMMAVFIIVRRRTESRRSS